MHVQLLGGFGVEVGGRQVDAGQWRLRKARTVVKLLALEPTQRLHREYLLDLLWPDLAPPAAANNLHQALHAARRAQAALDGGDLDGLCAADTSYPGELLPEDPYEPWTRGPREELHALHRDVLVRLSDRLRAAGRLAEAEAALDRALARDPMHEPALRVLLRVLAEQGRRSTALLRYERARDDLRSAYGTDPDPETRRLYRDLLVGSASTDAAEPGDSLAARRHNLLPAVTSFVGRERELAQVHRLLQRTQLLTLTGPGGAGKTRLARQTAHGAAGTMQDGAWLVDLVPVGTGTWSRTRWPSRWVSRRPPGGIRCARSPSSCPAAGCC